MELMEELERYQPWNEQEERDRAELFDKMQALPLKYFDAHTHGELMSRYTNDIETVSEALNNSFASVISCSLNFLGTIAMMLVLSPLLTLITFAALAAMLMVVKVVGGQSRRYFAAQQKAVGEVNGYIEEMIEGQKVIKYEDYIQYGSEAAVREAGKMGVEGKDYVVQDGDIMHFRFNV